MKPKKQSSLLVPVLVGIGLTVLVIIIASTTIFDQVIDYIHTNSISPLGAVLCIVAAGFAFFAVFKILCKLGNTMLPQDKETEV